MIETIFWVLDKYLYTSSSYSYSDLLVDGLLIAYFRSLIFAIEYSSYKYIFI